MATIQSPCYDAATKTDCPRRHGGCAIGCREWEEYVEKRDEENRRRYLENTANSVIVGSSIKHLAKHQRHNIADRARRRKV